MIRNSKALGLALVAVFALSAVAASSAQAGLKLTAANYPAVLTGRSIKHIAGETEPFVHTFTLSGGVVATCKNTTYVGTVTAVTESVTIIPKYGECSVRIGPPTLPATVTMEDCDYVFRGGVEEASPEIDKFEKGEIDLVCPEGKKPIIHVYETAMKHVSNESLCTLTLSPFVNKVANTYTNTTGASDDVDIATTAKEIAVTRTGSILCGPVNQTATYTGSTTLTGFKDSGSETPSAGTLKEINEGESLGVTFSK